MPQKRCATKARLQNLHKIKNNKEKPNYGKSPLVTPPEARFGTLLLQTAVLDEPDTPDTDNVPTVPNEDNDSEGSDVEIFNGGSDVDIYEETELMKFSRMLSDAQKKAQAEEKAKGNKWKTYNGCSQTTAHRRKRYWGNLAASGYLPVYEFMKQMEAQKTKDKLTASATVEESEESSDDDAITVSWLGTRSNEPGTEIKELAPAASGDHCRIVQGPVTGERCHQAAQHLAEEEEESSGNKDEDVASKNNTHLGAMLFEDLWSRVLMESAESSCLSSDGTPASLFGHPKLRAACAELMAKAGDKDLDLVTQQRIQGMLGHLNLYLDKGLNLGWKKNQCLCRRLKDMGTLMHDASVSGP
jgi:hypothetical protein